MDDECADVVLAAYGMTLDVGGQSLREHAEKTMLPPQKKNLTMTPGADMASFSIIGSVL